MTPQEALKLYGATMYSTMKNGITPQLFYRWNEIKFNNGTFKYVLEYLSYANIWMGSGLKNTEILTQIN